MHFRRLAGSCAAILLLSLAAQRSEAKDPKLKEVPSAPGVQREQINLVLIDVVVTDKKGHRVDDLRPEEFSLRVDGKPHPIESVELQWSAGTLVNEPTSAPAEKAREREPLLKQQSNRRFVFLLDGLNCERGLGAPAIEAVRKFLRKGLPSGDEVMVTGLGRDFKVYQEFTSDRVKMLSALDAIESDPRMRNAGENHVHQNIIRMEEEKENCTRCDALQREQAGQRVATTFADEDERRTRRTLAALRALVSYLHSGISQRKEVFFLTDGFFADPFAFYGTPDIRSRGRALSPTVAVSSELRLDGEILRLTREAAAAQVAIHTINTQGVTRGSVAGLQHVPDRPWATLIESDASNTLSGFALGTGGVAYHGNDDFEAAMVRVEEETRATYRLAYVPSGNPDGKYHAVKVGVLRKGLQVRAKEGLLYLTSEQLQESQLLAAYLSPELFRDFPMTLEARSYLRDGTKPEVELALAIPDDSLLFLPRAGEYAARLEVGMVVRAGKSQVVDQFSRTVEAVLGAQVFATRGALTLLASRPIPSGEYDTVTVVRDLGTGNIGALRSSIKVPTFAPGKIAMSTLLLESDAQRGRRVDIDPSTKEDEALVVPAVTRVFSRGAKVVGSCLVYHPERDKSTGEARVRVRGSIQKEGATVREIADTLHTFSAEEKADVIPLQIPLPLSDLGLGIYSLNVQALDEIGGRGVVQRVDFMLK
ncbi:MAG TPA: VWA domain-containing protein [Candidatus Polarisedimenticolia bacterium]|nr:VWA domain-containing protein [Candidatus Polarisedimenticolia bacterium]